uniref:Protein kinase domain-containing protein n=1 Tax=Macrostomum lignano TaxID=282301 RepID=A0A1I8FP04_9PLAT
MKLWLIKITLKMRLRSRMLEKRAAGSRRQSEMIGQSEGRSRDELDFSSQGLTMGTELSVRQDAHHCAEPELQQHRGLPPEISNLTQLRHLDLSRQRGLRCAHPRDFTSLPKEMETMAELRDLMHIPPAVWSIVGLEKLDISRNKVGAIPSDIMKLERLVHLNATQTGIKTLPEEIVCCDALESLLLCWRWTWRPCKVNAFAQESDQPFPSAVCSFSASSPYSDVSRNGFKTLPWPAALKDLRSLRVLLAPGQQPAHLRGLAGATSTELERIDLGFNCIAKLPDNIATADQAAPPSCCWQPLGCVAEVAVAAWVISFKTLGPLTGNRGFDFNSRRRWLAWPGWTGDMRHHAMAIQNARKAFAPAQAWCSLVTLGSGKTSLARPSPSRTDAARQSRTEPLPAFVLLEAGGFTRSYAPLLAKLLDPKALHCVVFDIAEYQQLGFDVVSRWLRLLAAHLPGARVDATDRHYSWIPSP